MPGSVRRLARQQPITLLTIRDHVKEWGRIPTATALAESLGLQPPAAAMRIQRLKGMRYLVQQEGVWTINEDEVVTQPETAALLIRFKEKCASGGGGKLPRREFLTLASDEAGLDEKQGRVIIRMLLGAKYLSEPHGWPEHLAIGPQVGNEYEYLESLARGREKRSLTPA